MRGVVWAAAGLALLVFLLRSFVGDVYPIALHSMEPSLSSGEWVWVRYGSQDLERYDVVAARDDAGTPIVKRLMGLPGEDPMIDLLGDVVVDGTALPPSANRPPPVLVFDSSLAPILERFQHGSTKLDPWVADGDICELRGRDVGLGQDAGMLRMTVNDGLLDPSGALVPGNFNVGDLVLECEVLPLAPGGRLRFEIVEERMTCSLAVELDDWPKVRVVLTADEPLAAFAVSLPENTWLRVRIANIDQRLSVQLHESRFESSLVTPERFPGGAVGNGVRLGGEGCQARFRAVRVLRDLHYVQRGSYGVGRRIRLGPDEFFLLGDNSAVSRDSREFGPVERDRILGRVTHVVWPLSRARSVTPR